MARFIQVVVFAAAGLISGILSSLTLPGEDEAILSWPVPGLIFGLVMGVIFIIRRLKLKEPKRWQRLGMLLWIVGSILAYYAAVYSLLYTMETASNHYSFSIAGIIGAGILSLLIHFFIEPFTAISKLLILPLVGAVLPFVAFIPHIDLGGVFPYGDQNFFLILFAVWQTGVAAVIGSILRPAP